MIAAPFYGTLPEWAIDSCIRLVEPETIKV
jgi:hypothetical protein